MSTITTTTTSVGGPTVTTSTPITIVQKVENWIFAFLQAHYGSGVAAIFGWLVSHFSLLSAIFGKVGP